MKPTNFARLKISAISIAALFLLGAGTFISFTQLAGISFVGAVGNGTTDDSAALTTACSQKEVWLTPGMNYFIGTNTTCAAAIHAWGGAKFTIGTGITLTLNGQVKGAPVPMFVEQGTGKVVLGGPNTLVPVEWFGAVADWNGTTGTNNLTAIQNTLNAITYGQAILSGPYAIGGTLNVTANYVGIKGLPVGRGINASLIETVAGDSPISEVGTSGSYIGFNKYQDFSISTSVAQTGTPAGILLSFTGGVVVQNVSIADFFYGVSAHASPSFGNGGIVNTNASWSSLSSAMTNPVCFYLPSTDGYAENSINLNQDSCNSVVGGPTQPIGVLITGTAVNDINVNNFATAYTNGPEVVFTGSGSGASCSDIHFINMTVDNFLTYGAEVSGCTAAQTGSVEFSGGWNETGPQTSGTGANFYILNSAGVSINHMQIGGHAGGNHPAQYGINIAGGSGNSVVGNTILNQSYAVNLTNSTTWNTVVGNTITNSTGGTLNPGIQINNSAGYNIVNDNTIAGANIWTNGLTIASGSNNNTYVGNTCGSNVTTCVSDSGTGNGIVNAQQFPYTQAAATYMSGAFFSFPNQAATDYSLFTVGWKSSAGDGIQLRFLLEGDANTSNAGCFGFIGGASCLLNYTYGGVVSTPNNTLDNGSGAATFKSLNVASARKGTFVCTGGGTITISNTNEAVTSDVIISLNTQGGTISTSPAMKTVTAGTGFTVLCGASDTSTYNYDILN